MLYELKIAVEIFEIVEIVDVIVVLQHLFVAAVFCNYCYKSFSDRLKMNHFSGEHLDY